ncbi:probable 37S ribosomal protein S24,mitochondrial [Zygosaccharomyces bailii ISA1307]|uniref:Small ribosomal subunit protein mS35 n=1 Tax=Zygosaccharomyces bailii (strain CLIB 213 / ATCC 58445 / CBS 680 / BCRC 21525 / NBRC 1098 / NCYC 1416 / NRRL Y-2227) TaxID=1333698 RepID=A0A8J2T200_ZYGB2|nr:BN860_12860g1_1 [Zygosaccharomyces bailii CLIB 213]CDH09530.1 probable 37S ribosomal protein S24,mitochondrial [Zygosaccharomyces bailii ISA1307]
MSFVSRRLISTSRTLLNKPAAEVANSTHTNLYLEPAKWKGLPSEKIFQLYRERIAKFGSRYQPCEEELQALLSTSEDTGVLKRDIRKIYYNGEKGAVDISGGSLKDNYSPTPFMFDELPSQAQDLVAQHREQRFYNRLAAYELPLLTQYRQEYKRLSPKTHPVEYRFTTYIGEEHPNARKVVLKTKVSDLGLNDKQRHKFCVLATTRYDSTTDIFKMSSDRHPEPAQNARYLSDVFQKLLKESKDMSDDFSDVPLDTRHTQAKMLRKKRHDYIFPDEWKRPQDAPKPKFRFVETLSENL